VKYERRRKEFWLANEGAESHGQGARQLEISDSENPTSNSQLPEAVPERFLELELAAGIIVMVIGSSRGVLRGQEKVSLQRRRTAAVNRIELVSGRH
jgi:hypothetical protein